jgi:hypothetical protein
MDAEPGLEPGASPYEDDELPITLLCNKWRQVWESNPPKKFCRLPPRRLANPS